MSTDRAVSIATAGVIALLFLMFIRWAVTNGVL